MSLESQNLFLNFGKSYEVLRERLRILGLFKLLHLIKLEGENNSKIYHSYWKENKQIKAMHIALETSNWSAYWSAEGGEVGYEAVAWVLQETLGCVWQIL